MAKEKEIKNKIRELRAKSWEVWIETKNLVNSSGHDDKIFFKHNMKMNAIKNVDDLRAIEKWLTNKKTTKK